MATDVVIPTSERIKKDVEYLKEWISKEPHLPNINDEIWLKTFLYQNKFSLEKTKFKLENYYSLRSKYPELLKNRDPTSPEMYKCRQYVKIGVSEKLLENKITWFLFARFEGDAKGFDAIVYAKRASMIFDLLLLKGRDRITDLILVIDYKDVGYLYFLKLMSVVAKLSEVLNNAYAERTKAVHLVNFPSSAQTFLELCQKLFSKKFNERTHVHSASKSTLLEMVDAEIVCRDFGGSGPILADLEEQTQQELEKHRKWFEEQDDVCSDENLRRKNCDQFEEMKGSFRKLEVD